MFKLKHLINRIQYNTLSQVQWLDGRGVCLDSKGQKIKPCKCVFMINNDKLTKYSFM